MNPLDRRLARLEGKEPSQAAAAMVVIADPGESMDAALARAPSARIVLPDNGRDKR
jgi:hypothetical protein